MESDMRRAGQEVQRLCKPNSITHANAARFQFENLRGNKVDGSEEETLTSLEQSRAGYS